MWNLTKQLPARVLNCAVEAKRTKKSKQHSNLKAQYQTLRFNHFGIIGTLILEWHQVSSHLHSWICMHTQNLYAHFWFSWKIIPVLCDIEWMHLSFVTCMHWLNIIVYLYIFSTTCAQQVSHIHSSQTDELINIICVYMPMIRCCGRFLAYHIIWGGGWATRRCKYELFGLLCWVCTCTFLY